MAWVAFDRAVRTLSRIPACRAAWRSGGRLRDEIHAEVCERGFNAKIGAFTQYYGSEELDASC